MDIGPYFVTALVHLFGPVDAVSATATTPTVERAIGVGAKAGNRFTVGVPTTVAVLTRFRSGAIAQSFYSFDTPLIRHGVFELTGSEATAILPDPVQFNGPTAIVQRIPQLTVWPPKQDPYLIPQDTPTGDRGLGIIDMARAIRKDRPHLASAELGYHVLDVLLSIEDSIQGNTWIPVTSSPGPVPAVPPTFDPRAATLLSGPRAHSGPRPKQSASQSGSTKY